MQRQLEVTQLWNQTVRIKFHQIVGVVIRHRYSDSLLLYNPTGPATASAALAAVCPHTPFMSDLAMATALNGRKGDYTPKAYLELVVALQNKAKELSTAGTTL